MYYYYHHHHNRGIQDQIRGDTISLSILTIKSIKTQLNSHEEQGLGNERDGWRMEDVKNVSVIEIFCL